MHNLVVPSLVPAVEWGESVYHWPDARRRYVKKMRATNLHAGLLPASLTELTFGSEFNQPLAAVVLPANLTQLTFGKFFNQPLAAGVLPASLTQLTFGMYFNQPLAAGVLPASLTQRTRNNRSVTFFSAECDPSRVS